MSQNITIEFEFCVDESIVAKFAQLTGDYNSMHMNPEVARKSKYRRTIVHGMIPLSFIQFLQTEFQIQSVLFVDLSARFIHPVFIDDKLTMIINYKVLEGTGEFDAIWTLSESGETITKSRGVFKLVSPSDPSVVTSDGDDVTFISDNISENQYLITDLTNQSETIGFKINSLAQHQYVNSILNHGVSDNVSLNRLCENLSALLTLSTMVGMKLPGRYAIFERFKLTFEKNILLDQFYTLKSSLIKVLIPAEIMNAAVVIENDSIIANGKISVLLNSPPSKMISSQEIIENFSHLGIKDKVVLITGASRGIGETTAKLFAALGSKVIINYFRGKTDAEFIVEEIRKEGGKAICIVCDITDDEAIKNMVAKAIGQYGRIDVLVNNAVRDFSPKDIVDLEWNDFLQEFNVSIKGLHACCKAVIPIFKENGGGKIINLSSVAVDNPVQGQSRYISAKSAVNGYTKSLAKELIKFNIQANLVVPNMTDTDLVSVLPTMFRDKIAQARPYGRHVLPIEVAQSIVFLASNWSNAMTGQKIVLNLGEPPFT